MKKRNIAATVFLAICFMFTSIIFVPSTAYAKSISTIDQAEKLAKKKVKGAKVVEVDADYEKGVFVYEVKLTKGKKEYDLTYRASDSKLISYGWEIHSWYVSQGEGVCGNAISRSRCKRLAKKQVPGGKILSVVKKRSDGIDIYKVKMNKGSKKYELEFHACTGKLIEYDWELTSKSNSGNKYIGAEKAKLIALEKTGGGVVTKVEFDNDDGVPVYEVEIIKDNYEYEVKVHAKTGKILEIDMDYI